MAKQLLKKSMRLFGLPYQFIPQVDPRLDGVSMTIGNKYAENVLIETPICTIIPGEPSYLPGQSTDKKVSTTAALLEGASEGFSSLTGYLANMRDEDLRLYDFKRKYNDYMKYVNVLCRSGATFLELDTKLDGVNFQQYDWRNYRQDAKSYTLITENIVKRTLSNIRTGLNQVKSTLSGKTMKYETEGDDSDSIESTLTNHNYVQFVVDPSVSPNESISNSTGESSIKSAMDQGSNVLKEIAFMVNSGGVNTDALNTFTSGAAESLNTGIQSMLGQNTVSSALSRIINLGSGIIKGENVIMPDIYNSSSYQKSYQLTVHLVSPYGTKLGYYLDIFVPMMHLLALAVPRQKSSNTYGSPFLVKAYVDAVFTCNMGIVSDISIQNVGGTLTSDGLPTKVDVTLSITDLYSDLMLTPSNSPIMFINNSSLIEFLATNCGLSLIAPNIKTKTEMTVNTITEAFRSIPDNITSGITEAIDNEIAKFTRLTWK